MDFVHHELFSHIRCKQILLCYSGSIKKKENNLSTPLKFHTFNADLTVIIFEYRVSQFGPLIRSYKIGKFIVYKLPERLVKRKTDKRRVGIKRCRMNC